MKYRSCIAGTIVLWFAAAVCAQEPRLSIAIGLPVYGPLDGESAVHLFAADSRTSNFPVVITNLSEKPLHLDSHLDALRFELTDASGKKTEAQAITQKETKNGLRYWILQPHQCVVANIEFANSNLWTGFPKPLRYGESQRFRLRAVYEVEKAEADAVKEDAWWSGKVESPEIQCELLWRISGVSDSRGIGISVEAGPPFGTVLVTMENSAEASDHSIESIKVISNGNELSIPRAALKGINYPLDETLEVSVEPDAKGDSVMYVSFELGEPNSSATKADYLSLHSAPRRVYFAFQDGKLIQRFTLERVGKIEDQWKP